MYNPWGEEMHQWNANTYAFTSPYRFNAKELDPETGLAYYGARYYQNKLGMWLSVDRLTEKYPHSSPYVFSGNNPITYVDPNGDSILVNVWNEVSGGFDNFSWQKNASGSWEFQDKDGNAYSGSDKSLRAMESGLNYLISGGTTGNDLVSELANNTSRSVTLLYSNNINRADGSGNFVSWNPNLTSSGPDVNGSNSRPAFTGLGHELAHIKDEWNGTKNIGIWFDNSTLSEIYACHVENKIRAENNIPLRKSYDTGGIYDVIDSQNRSIFFNSSENNHPNFYQIRPKESRYVYK
jgi:RHS repeat-associated protein